MKASESLVYLLYAKSSQDSFPEISACVGSTIEVGMQGAGFSKAGNAAVKARSNRKSKINMFVSFVEKLFSENIAAVQIANEKVFVEYTSFDNARVAATYDGKTISFVGDIPKRHSDMIIPIAAYALSDACPIVETKETFEELVKLIDSGAAGNEIQEKLFTVCDALYYEMKEKNYLNTNVEINDELLEESIKEAARTEGADPIKAIAPGASYPRVMASSIISTKSDTSAAAAPKTNMTTMFDQMKRGDYIVNYGWTLDQRKYIQDLDYLDKYIPHKRFFKVFCRIKRDIDRVIARMDMGLSGNKAIGDDYCNIQMYGNPGSGKSSIGYAVAAALGLPIQVLNLSKHTDEDAFTGGTKVQEGGFHFVAPPFLEIFKHGGIILLEEYNLADPGVMMGSLGQAIEKPFILLEDGYKQVPRHPLCIVIATKNLNTNGSRDQNQALITRLPGAFKVNDPDDDTRLKIMKTHVEEATDSECKKVLGIYKSILAYCASDQVQADDAALVASMRGCIEALKQMHLPLPYGTKDEIFKEAIQDSLIGSIESIGETELAAQLYDACVKIAKR